MESLDGNIPLRRTSETRGLPILSPQGSGVHIRDGSARLLRELRHPVHRLLNVTHRRRIGTSDKPFAARAEGASRHAGNLLLLQELDREIA